jgi:hypothetical protein
MTTHDRIRQVAEREGALTAAGVLKPLDSLAIVDMIVAIEQEFGITIPTVDLTPQTFTSVESVSAFVESVVAVSRQAPPS